MRASDLQDAFADTLHLLSGIFEAHATPFMLVGGLAVGAWVEPRATRDIDLALTLLDTSSGALMSALEAGGARFSKIDAAAVATDGGPLRITFAGQLPIVVDLLVAGTNFERSAVARRRRVPLFGVEMWVCSPDDLLIYKLIASRPQDLADIDRLLRAGLVPEDRDYCSRWIDEWALQTQYQAALLAAQR